MKQQRSLLLSTQVLPNFQPITLSYLFLARLGLFGYQKERRGLPLLAEENNGQGNGTFPQIISFAVVALCRLPAGANVAVPCR